MTPRELVLQILRVEGIALAITVIAIFGWAGWSRASFRQRARRMSMARAMVASHLETRQLPARDLALLRGLPSEDLRHFFFEIAPSVGPTERAWLRSMAQELGELSALIAETQSSEWWTRLAAARLLTLLDAEPALVLPLARDPEPVVRAQTATYVAQRPTPEGIEHLIAMLADPDALCRFSAKDALMRLGGAATPQLVARLANPDDAQTPSVLEVAAAIPTHDFLAGAVAHIADARADVRLLVTRLLRGIGGAQAAEELSRLALDPAPVVRAAAVEALGYLNHWVAAPTIARLLEDNESRVRLAAALALDQLGPAGELLLRRARAKGSANAVAAATRILDDASRASALAPGSTPRPA